MRTLICGCIVAFLVRVNAQPDEVPGFASKIKAAKKPVEGTDWKLFKDANKKTTVLLPRSFNERNAPEDEKNTVLYCIAGGSLKDYRLAKIVSDPALEVPEVDEKNLPGFTKEYLVKQISKRFMNAKILERAIVEVDGKKSFLIVSDGASQGGFRVTSVYVITRVDGLTHQLSLSCLTDNFEKYSESFAPALLSWRFVI